MLEASYRCDEILPLLRTDAMETLKGLEFYLKTLEEFIEAEHSQEVANLKRHADRLPREQQGEFWAWHYPVHWNEIFSSQLRSSFIVTLVSLSESHVGMVAEQACEIAGAPLKAGDLRGGLLERNRKCLNALAGFMHPDDRSWNLIYEIRDMRNCIVHANSRIWEAKNPNRLRSLACSLPGLAAPSDVLELSREFPPYALISVRDFVLALYDEAERLCRRTMAWRSGE